MPQLLAEYRIHEASASFRVMPQSRAEEIVQVMRAYWAERSDQARAQRSLARAYSLAAKNHGQSGRLGASLHCLGQALRIRPVLALDMAVWRQLFVGLLRRGWYQLRASTRTV